MHSHPFALPLLLALAGAILSIVAEKICIVPKSAREGMRGPFLLRLGVWFWAYATILLVTGRPIFSLALALALFVTLILVNNAKYESLKEPFIFQDYDYFLDTIRCPRLFLPFFGVQAFWGCVSTLLVGRTAQGKVCAPGAGRCYRVYAALGGRFCASFPQGTDFP